MVNCVVVVVGSYEHVHERVISPPAVAQLLSTTLYGRRFFPYYAFCVLAGLDDEGKGAVYTYDAVGSFERVGYACQGSGQRLVIPFLDNVVGMRNRADKATAEPMTPEVAMQIVKDAFITAGEREIYVGDAVDVFLINKAGTARSRFDLKLD